MAIETEKRPEGRNENLVDSFRRRLKGRALDRAKGFPRSDVTSLSSIRVRAKNLIFRRRKQALLLRIVSSHRIVSTRARARVRTRTWSLRITRISLSSRYVDR